MKLFILSWLNIDDRLQYRCDSLAFDTSEENARARVIRDHELSDAERKTLSVREVPTAIGEIGCWEVDH